MADAYEEFYEIGNIGNYYGGLAIMKNKGRFYWGIENWDGYNWDEISEVFYNQLLNYEENRNNG